MDNKNASQASAIAVTCKAIIAGTNILKIYEQEKQYKLDCTDDMTILVLKNKLGITIISSNKKAKPLELKPISIKDAELLSKTLQYLDTKSGVNRPV
jgi:hypothetical protein